MAEYDAEEIAAQLARENSRENINKRRRQREQRRRMHFFRGIIKFICTLFFIVLASIAGYYIIGWGSGIPRCARYVYGVSCAAGGEPWYSRCTL